MGEDAFRAYLLDSGYDAASVEDSLPYFRDSKDQTGWDFQDWQDDDDGPDEDDEDDEDDDEAN